MGTRVVLTLIACLIAGCGVYPLAKYGHGSGPTVPGSEDQTYDFLGGGVGLDVHTRHGDFEFEAAIGVKEVRWNGTSREFGADFSVTYKHR